MGCGCPRAAEVAADSPNLRWWSDSPGQPQAAQVAVIDGVPGAVWAAGGRPIVVFAFTVHNGKVVEIELVAEAERLRRLQIEILE
jgi:hypothetical protein